MVLSVSELNIQIKSLIDSTFLQVQVQGEISNLTLHSSGHIYFSLKDADSQIRCVMFKGNANGLIFELHNGANVIISGGVSVYTPRGEYQIICKSIVPDGIGALTLRFNQLKQKLQAQGYFEHKKPLPPFPKRIAILTSTSGAALQDMLKVARKRWNLVQIVVINTLVQGSEAKDSIAHNIAYADSFFGTSKAFDVIIVGRGGGSMEDLWAFNEEIVAQAIFNARTPIISAVGHEVDTLISDFVADVRAPTPSAAMEMLLPDSKEWLMRIDDMLEICQSTFAHILAHKKTMLENLNTMLESQAIETKLTMWQEQIVFLMQALHTRIHTLLEDKQHILSSFADVLTLKTFIESKQAQLDSVQHTFNALNPNNIYREGYAQILHNGKVVGLKQLIKGDEVELVDSQTSKKAHIIS